MTVTPRVSAPEAPGRLGEAIEAPEILAYLSGLEAWLDDRRAELDRLDAAARAAATPDAYTTDLVLALTLWQAIRGRADEMRTVWDSGRVDVVARERLSQLIWGRLDSGDGAALVSLVEAAKLCDALVGQLRTRLSFDPHTADHVARLRGLRAELVRCEDLARATEDTTDDAQIAALRDRLERLVAQAARGADVSGPLAELEATAARTERDLIVAAAQHRELIRDRQAATAQRDAIAAREPALRELVARARREVADPPRLAVPDVSRLGPVPTGRAELDAYTARLAVVERAVRTVEDAYAAPLRERAELRYRLEGYHARAEANGRATSPTVRAGYAEASAAVETTPCVVPLARFLVEQYQFLTRDLPAGLEGGSR